MFRPKGPLQGRTNILGDKDRKNLRNAFTAQFPKKTVDDFLKLVPSGLPLSLFSLKGVSCEVYISGEEPVFFVLSKKKTAQLFPTLQTLWKMPDLLPQIIVEVKTPPFLVRGADLMLPGCRPPPGGYAAAGMDIDQAWSVRIADNPMPFAVGQVVMTADDLAALDKGKILQVHHVLGDLLLKMKVPDTLPDGISMDNCLPLEKTEADEAVETDSDEESAQDETSPVVSEPKKVEVSESDGDEEDDDDDDESTSGESSVFEAIIELCIVELIQRRWTDNQLPLDVSAVWGDITKLVPIVVNKADLSAWLRRRNVSVTPSKSGLDKFANQTDLKATGWKTVKKMANHFKRTKIWTTKEIRGQVSVVKVNRSHPLVNSHKTLLPEDAIQPVTSATDKSNKSKSKKDVAKPASPSGTQLEPVVVYGITGLSRDLFTSIGRDAKEGLLTVEMVTECLQKMIDNVAADVQAGEGLYPSMGQPAGKAVDTPQNVEWTYDLIMRDSKLSTLCLTKNERSTLKTEGSLGPLNKTQIVNKFVQSGMKPVTLLLHNLSDLPQALKSPQDFDVIEAEAKISVSLQRTKRFTRTRVAGIHDFPMIDPKQLAEKLQKACAAAATLCELDEVKGKTKPVGVVVQGSVVREVCHVLESQYGLPSSMINA